MFNKLFKKKKKLIILHQRNGISGNGANESAKALKDALGCNVILVPYGFSLSKINDMWVLEAFGETRGRFTQEDMDHIKSELGTDVILIRYGLSINIYEEE